MSVCIDEQRRLDFQWFIAQLPPCLSKIITDHAKEILKAAEMKLRHRNGQYTHGVQTLIRSNAACDRMLMAVPIRRVPRALQYSANSSNKYWNTRKNIKRANRRIMF